MLQRTHDKTFLLQYEILNEKFIIVPISNLIFSFGHMQYMNNLVRETLLCLR